MTWSEAEYQAYLSRTRQQGAPPPAPVPAKARAIFKDPYQGMNGLEKAYAQEVLEPEESAGLVALWRFGSVNLKLAESCYYRTDFFVVLVNGEVEIRETKGYLREDALVKLKVAAALYPFRFRMLSKVRGEWMEREF